MKGPLQNKVALLFPGIKGSKSLFKPPDDRLLNEREWRAQKSGELTQGVDQKQGSLFSLTLFFLIFNSPDHEGLGNVNNGRKRWETDGGVYYKIYYYLNFSLAFHEITCGINRS